MKFGKRLLSVFLALTFALSLCVMPVSADEENVVAYPEYGTKAYGRMEFMDALGFLAEGDKENLGRAVTRAEFAKWLCLVANKTDAVIPANAAFSDVNEETLYAEEIYIAVASGYMSGSDDGKFYPNAAISKQDAAAALVRLTGRDAFARAKGGYPTGYISVANSLGIMNSVGGDANAYNLLTMCYNTLNATVLVFNGANYNYSTYETDKKVMEYYHNIYEVKGVVTANGFTKLYTEDLIASSESIEIERIVYKTTKDFNDLIGMTVKGFYYYDEINDEKTVVSIYADNDENKVVEFDCDDLIPTNLASNYILRYTDENYRTKQVKLVRGFDYIYNNRVDTDRGANDLFTADKIKLIDRDTDGYYDTVIAEKAETMKLSTVDLFKEEVYTDTAVLKKADEHGSYLSFAYYNIEEDTMTEVFPEQLEAGMVLTVYRSLDGMYVKAYASDNAISGVVEGYDNENVLVMISGEWYELAETVAVADFDTGVEVDLLLDIYGRIAYIDGVGGKYDFKYAYLFSIRDDAEKEVVTAKLITKAGQITLNLEDYVIIDGVRAVDTAALVLSRGVIRYKINKAGNIRVIDTTATVGGSSVNDTLTEDVAPQTLLIYPLSSIIAGSYKITNKTFTLVVPGVISERENIDLYDTKFNLPSTEPKSYQFACYDIDDEDASIGVCIYYPQESLMGQATTSGDTGIGAIKKIQRRVWIDGEVENLVTIHTSDGEATYITADSITDSNLDAFSFGDVVRYVINAKGEMSTIFMELDVTNTSGATHPASRTTLYEYANGNYNYAFGPVIKKESDYFIMISNENNTGFNDSLANRRIIYTPRLRNCWLVDMSENKIVNCDLSDITEYIAGHESPSYVYARTYKYYELPNLVVYKY